MGHLSKGRLVTASRLQLVCHGPCREEADRESRQDLNQKNPRAHKNKIGTPPPPKKPKIPPPPPKKKRNFMDMGFPAERTHFSRRNFKTSAPISGPRIADRNFTDTRILLTKRGSLKTTGKLQEGDTFQCCSFFQRKRDDNKNEICAFQGGWAGGQRGKLCKTLFFMGNVMTIKFRK